jgi:hypothetical protein
MRVQTQPSPLNGKGLVRRKPPRTPKGRSIRPSCASCRRYSPICRAASIGAVPATRLCLCAPWLAYSVIPAAFH